MKYSFFGLKLNADRTRVNIHRSVKTPPVASDATTETNTGVHPVFQACTQAQTIATQGLQRKKKIPRSTA